LDPHVERFVVGTGRCGSTLLSRMLAEHASVCSLFEFFTGLDWAERFAPGLVSGRAFAELLSRSQPVIDAVLRRGYPVEEVVYPFGRGRFARGDTMPWILVSMLPRLTADPDRLFDATLAFARARPEQSLRAHYHALFAWLGAETGRPHWVERSGSSVDYVGALAAFFPAARFVHVHRDGREAALSMREHHAYRVPISLIQDAPLASGRRPSELGPIDWIAPPRADDPISQILASRPPVAAFGRYWSDQVVRGREAAAALDPSQWLEVRFEDVIAAPRETLTRIASHLKLPPDEGWLARAAALVRGVPPARSPELPAAERETLEVSCEPGMRLLGRV
jgi:hypothetical protein